MIVQAAGEVFHAISGPDGKFQFASLQPTRYTVRVTRPGFVLAVPKQRPTIMFQLVACEVVTDKLTLAPESFVSGRVVDSDGNPVELANVQVMRAAKFQAGRLTNDRGEFRIPALIPGSYLIRVTPNAPRQPREIRTDGTREQQDIPTYYSASTTLEGATRVDVPEGGGGTGIEIRLGRAPIVTVSGTIVGLEAKAYPSLHLVRGADRVDVPFEMKDGKFAFPRLSPGNYSLILRAWKGRGS